MEPMMPSTTSAIDTDIDLYEEFPGLADDCDFREAFITESAFVTFLDERCSLFASTADQRMEFAWLLRDLAKNWHVSVGRFQFNVMVPTKTPIPAWLDFDARDKPPTQAFMPKVLTVQKLRWTDSEWGDCRRWGVRILG